MHLRSPCGCNYFQLSVAATVVSVNAAPLDKCRAYLATWFRNLAHYWIDISHLLWLFLHVFMHSNFSLWFFGNVQGKFATTHRSMVSKPISRTASTRTKRMRVVHRRHLIWMTTRPPWTVVVHTNALATSCGTNFVYWHGINVMWDASCFRISLQTHPSYYDPTFQLISSTRLVSCCQFLRACVMIARTHNHNCITHYLHLFAYIFVCRCISVCGPWYPRFGFLTVGMHGYIARCSWTEALATLIVGIALSSWTAFSNPWLSRKITILCVCIWITIVPQIMFLPDWQTMLLTHLSCCRSWCTWMNICETNPMVGSCFQRGPGPCDSAVKLGDIEEEDICEGPCYFASYDHRGSYGWNEGCKDNTPHPLPPDTCRIPLLLTAEVDFGRPVTCGEEAH